MDRPPVLAKPHQRAAPQPLRQTPTFCLSREAALRSPRLRSRAVSDARPGWVGRHGDLGVVPEPASLLGVDDVAAQWSEGYGNELEVRQAEWNPDDGDAHQHAGDEVPD